LPLTFLPPPTSGGIYWAFQLLSEKSVEKEQKQFRALLVSKGFFESGIQRNARKIHFFEFFSP
jgi:hypothetical protein